MSESVRVSGQTATVMVVPAGTVLFDDAQPCRGLRVLAGFTLIGLTLTGIIGAWGWIGVVPLATGAFRFCPLHTMLGIRTCSLPR